MDKETAKKVALGAAVGLTAGAALTMAYYMTNANILKKAEWTPQGDMILWFYHQKNAILVPNPKVP